MGAWCVWSAGILWIFVIFGTSGGFPVVLLAVWCLVSGFLGFMLRDWGLVGFWWFCGLELVCFRGVCPLIWCVGLPLVWFVCFVWFGQVGLLFGVVVCFVWVISVFELLF